MATQGNVTKIYDLKTIGYDPLMKELDAVNKKFLEIKKTKQDLNKEKAKVEDPAVLADLKKKLEELAIAEAKLRVEKKELTNEAKAQQIQRQAEINQRRQEQQSVVDAANSYNALNRERRELYNTIKATPKGDNVDFRGQILAYDQAIAKLKELSAAEQNFRRQFTQDGLLVGEYTSGIIQAFKNMGLDDLIGGQITKANNRLTELNQNFEVLKKELSNVGVNGQGNLEMIERQLIENRNEAMTLQQQLGRIQTEFRGMGDIGNQITTSISNGFKELKGQIGQMIVGFIGFQAAFNGIIEGVQGAKELSDQTTNLEIELGKAAGGANNLVSELSKLDTRTKLSGLEDIANIAAKAGVAEKDLLGVTQSIDKIKIAFGKDFGNVEEGTESLVKLINIFEGEGNVTGENLLKTGNAIRTLANESVASVPFLNDFSKRMAGLKGISDISLPAVLGLASGFEQFGQSAEVASTSLVKIIPKLASDTEKYAEIAGITKQAFADLINSNPAEALIKVSEGLVKGKGSIEEISQAFSDSELGSGRIASVLGVVGKNADAFRHSIASAGEAFNNTSNIETAFTAKNENLAASLDKIGKKFADAANSEAFKFALTSIAAVITFLLTNLPTLLVLLGLLAVNWAVQNQQLVLLNLRLIAYNAAIGASYVALGLLSVAQLAYNAIMLVTNTVVGLATRALAAFGITLKATSGPLGIILTLVALLGSAFVAVGAMIKNATESFAKHNRELAIAKEVLQEANAAIAEQKSQAQALSKVVGDLTISEQTRNKALQDLIKIDPIFQKTLVDGKININKLNEALLEYNANLLKKAELEASQQRQTKEFQELVRLENIKQGLEIAKAQGKGFGDLTDEEKSQFSKFSTSVGRTAFTSDLFNSKINQGDFKEAFKSINDQINAQSAIVDAATNVFKEKFKQSATVVTDGVHSVDAAAKNFEIDIERLKAQIAALDEQINKFQGRQSDLNKLVAQRKTLQAQLDKALGNNNSSTYRGSRLSGEQRDALKDIDAARDQQLAEEKLKRSQNKIDEETYLLDILKINQKAIDDKLKLLKGANAEERKQIAEFQVERINDEMETNQKIFDLKEKSIKLQLEKSTNTANNKAKVVTDDPSSTESQKVQARLDADQEILKAQEQYAKDLDQIEKQTNNQSLKNEQEIDQAIIKSRQQLSKDGIDLAKANLADIRAAGERSVAEFKAVIAAQRNSIAQSRKSPDQKDRANVRLDKEENIGILAREVSSLETQLPKYKQLLAQKQITDQEYYNFLVQLNEKQVELYNALNDTTDKAKVKITDLRSFIQSGMRDLFNVKSGSDTDKAFGEALGSVYETATVLMNNYFDAEKQRIEENLQLQLDRIDADKKRVEARATTSQELANIDKQYAAKTKKAQQEAFEQTKKVKREEAKISLATELGNIWATVWSVGNPIAAAILGAVLTGLAIIRYQSNINQINSAKFAFGGKVGDVPSRGGKFGGKPHSQGGTPFSFKGKQYEAEVDELSVIRTRNAPANQLFNVIGTQSQIASAMNQVGGGVSFAPGASVSKFDYGGNLGESLQPPVFVPAANVSNVAVANNYASQTMDALIAQGNAIQAVNSRIDRLQVIQVTDTVTDAQKKKVKQSQVGTL